jgi:hypothetical protein
MYNFSKCKRCTNLYCWWRALNRNESKKEFLNSEQKRQFAHCKKFKS